MQVLWRYNASGRLFPALDKGGGGVKSFMMSMNQKTIDFLVEWYDLPIQDVLRTLAAVDKATKETTK